MRISCPHCGLRDHTEFEYGGDAARGRPDLSALLDQWTDYVYLRDNPRGPHREYWQHVHGCREWVIVVRDTLSHDVSSVVLARTLPLGATELVEGNASQSDVAAAEVAERQAPAGSVVINGAAHDGTRQPDGEEQ